MYNVIPLSKIVPDGYTHYTVNEKTVENGNDVWKEDSLYITFILESDVGFYIKGEKLLYDNKFNIVKEPVEYHIKKGVKFGDNKITHVFSAPRLSFWSEEDSRKHWKEVYEF